ncbi:hemolysin family protein [Nocardiopsis rhodophaea]|uniref:Hemolysin family protein n=1 Tax=Nocardiopsis rhodophaea TaxID=280238 RepID=A0ABP5DFI4_9ACTN
MSNPWIVLGATVLLIALSASFVVIEFSLLGARRHRLEEAAVSSRAARAALRCSNELTIVLAGAQLGITACTFALGAVTKPALDGWLSPLLASIGLPLWIADISSFALSLLLVTFLHLVVGEMAPKSWAIAHPEFSAALIGLPTRGLIRLLRPLLVWVNKIANRLVEASGVEPVDRAAVAGYDAATIRHLVEHSANVGVLHASYRTSLSGALALPTMRIESLVPPGSVPTAVSANATVHDLQDAAVGSGHMRILVDHGEGDALGVVHVRDTMLEPPDRPVRELARVPFVVPTGTPVHEVLTAMRQASEQLAVVVNGARIIGVVTIADILRNVLPRSSA